MGRFTIVASTIVSAVVMMGEGARPAHACSCSARDACPAGRGTALFEGYAESATEVVVSAADGGQPSLGFRMVKTRFRVTRVWRGNVGRSVDVLSGPGDADCGIRFEKGGRYIVDANPGPAGELATGACTCTSRWTRKADRLLGAGTRPVDGAP